MDSDNKKEKSEYEICRDAEPSWKEARQFLLNVITVDDIVCEYSSDDENDDALLFKNEHFSVVGYYWNRAKENMNLFNKVVPEAKIILCFDDVEWESEEKIYDNIDFYNAVEKIVSTGDRLFLEKTFKSQPTAYMIDISFVKDAVFSDLNKWKKPSEADWQLFDEFVRDKLMSIAKECGLSIDRLFIPERKNRLEFSFHTVFRLPNDPYENAPHHLIVYIRCPDRVGVGGMYKFGDWIENRFKQLGYPEVYDVRSHEYYPVMLGDFFDCREREKAENSLRAAFERALSPKTEPLYHKIDSFSSRDVPLEEPPLTHSEFEKSDILVERSIERLRKLTDNETTLTLFEKMYKSEDARKSMFKYSEDWLSARIVDEDVFGFDYDVVYPGDQRYDSILDSYEKNEEYFDFYDDPGIVMACEETENGKVFLVYHLLT